MRKIIILLFLSMSLKGFSQTENLNYSRDITIVKRGNTTQTQVDQLITGDKFQKTTYFDGLNRPIQTVIMQGSVIPRVLGRGEAIYLRDATDLVKPITYDELGNTPLTYLSYASSTADGHFKADPITEQNNFYSDANPNSPIKGQGETYYYGKANFEPSPLNRVTKTMLPGNSWVGSDVGILADYDFNTQTEKVHIWSIDYTLGAIPSTSSNLIYPDGQLAKTITTDEKLKKVITYTDKSGNIILKKVQDKDGTNLSVEHSGWLCTYYVYDDFGRQRYIIPPKAVVYLDNDNWVLNQDVINELCFSNEYDQRGRLIVKKSPGADPIYLVYDQRDRLVFSQDGNQRTRTTQKWMATLYDNLDRVTSTGFIDYSSSRANLQLYVDGVSNDGTNVPIVITTTTPRQGNIIIDAPVTSPLISTATSSIALAPGFATTTSNFTAQIDTRGIPVTDNTPVNQNVLPPNNNFYPLTLTFYDNYTYAGAKTFSNNFTIDNTLNADEAEDVSPTLQTIGLVTGTRVRLLDDGNTFLTTTSYYDYKGRVIQVQGDNHKGFNNETTTQYDFSGKVRSTYEYHRFDGNSDIKLYTQNTYDYLGRLSKIKKVINGNSGKTIASYTYDALGQLSNKKLSPDYGLYYDDPAFESLNYTYNIQGWLLGINKDYVQSTSQTGYDFGMEFGYDKPGNANFPNKELNGNIAGIEWKTSGNNKIRRYDYTYDNENQLLNADFNQNDNPGQAFSKSKMDFSSNYTYDENGNIKTQNQWGVLTGLAPLQIDQQVYHYDLVVPGGWTNKLSNIDERILLFSNGNLGDFKNGSAGSVSQQYWYDKNANLSRDLNKEIGNATSDGTQYNFMNLPTLVTFKNTNKTITYVYDAAGNKVRKILDEPVNGKIPARHVETDYDENYIYETIPVNLGGTGVPVLQFFGHEEGRVRPVFTPSGESDWAYDYFIKDHLSNVRMILTEEQKQDIYPAATLETSKLVTEQTYYDINTGQIADNSTVSGIPNYQNNNSIANPPTNATFDNANSARLYTLNSSQKTGLGIALKVMSGDHIDIFGKSYYVQNNPNPGGNSQLLAADIINALLASPTGAAAGKGDVNNILSSTNITTPLNSFLTNHNPASSNKPKAFINYILLDEQFNYVSGGISPVNDNPYMLKDHHPELQNIPVTTNGYLYVYCSNESPVDVFFDNVQVVHTSGRILEENHYYSFGLKIASISSKAAGSLQNKSLYQGDFAENDQETALDEFALRHYDPQIGRWTTTDPKEQFASPYLGMGNNPISNVDPDGGGDDNWIKYTLGNTTYVHWWDDPAQAFSELGKAGATGIEDLGLEGFWQSNLGGAKNWFLSSDKNAYKIQDEIIINPTYVTARENLYNSILSSEKKGWTSDLYAYTHRIYTDYPQSVFENAAKRFSNAIQQSFSAYEVNNPYLPPSMAHYGVHNIDYPTIDPVDIAAAGVGGLFKASAGVFSSEVAAAETGTNLVYQGLDKAGIVRYVGITEREAAIRFGEHLNSGTAKSLLRYEVIDGATGLSRTGARVWEQTLINKYGLQKNGGLLLNRINSITPKNWWQYGIK